MSGNVIEFPVGISERRKATASNAPHTNLGAPVDIAVWIHDLIIDGLNSGEWRDCDGGPVAALDGILTDDYGGDLAAAAAGCFELIYGCDPYTFLMRVGRHGAPRPGPLTV
jgi:hypothetical protein